MHKYDVWLDLECVVDGSKEVVCTLFARRDFAIRPLRDEAITFWSAKDSTVSFSIVTVVGIQSQHYVGTAIDELAHHFHPEKNQDSASTFLRCLPVHVASIEDARRVVAFLSEQHGFEVDPYGINKLKD